MWSIETTDVFDEWFDALDDIDKENVLATLLLLQQKGPQLSRPYADAVNGSKFANMKELRTQSKGNPMHSIQAELVFYCVLERKQGKISDFMNR